MRAVDGGPHRRHYFSSLVPVPQFAGGYETGQPRPPGGELIPVPVHSKTAMAAVGTWPACGRAPRSARHRPLRARAVGRLPEACGPVQGPRIVAHDQQRSRGLRRAADQVQQLRRGGLVHAVIEDGLRSGSEHGLGKLPRLACPASGGTHNPVGQVAGSAQPAPHDRRVPQAARGQRPVMVGISGQADLACRSSTSVLHA